VFAVGIKLYLRDPMRLASELDPEWNRGTKGGILAVGPSSRPDRRWTVMKKPLKP
jgi:hypothetical protein